MGTERKLDGELREQLGRRVREVWITWAKEQPNPKASWLKAWEELSEADREVDRRIGETIWNDCLVCLSSALVSSAIAGVESAR